MHDEVRVVADSPRLSALTAKTVGKALQLMAEKAEYMTFAGMPSLILPKAHAHCTQGNSCSLDMIANPTCSMLHAHQRQQFMTTCFELFRTLTHAENKAAYRIRVMHT